MSAQTAKPVIAFVSAVCPWQYSTLSEYLNRSGLAEAHLLTVEGHAKRLAGKFTNLRVFKPDGPITGLVGYYYSMKIERSARISKGLFEAFKTLMAEKNVDLVVAHSLWGAPYFLYDEFNVPVISYMEFPSYRLHGWAPEYPPDLAQRLTDHNMEMVSYYQALRSDRVIVPSSYAKSLFPAELQPKIHVQFEGFEPPAPAPAPAGLPAKEQSVFVIGFSARDLSSAKGFDLYVELAAEIARRGLNIRCVAIGSDEVSTYSYEPQFVERYYKDPSKRFRYYLHERYPDAKIDYWGILPYDEFSQRLNDIDLFVYPLRHGVANWGLIEILMRGRPIVASNRCFIPEIIRHQVNGMLVDEYNNLDAWIDAILQIRDDDVLRERLCVGAELRGQEFFIERVAPSFLKLFMEVIEARRDPKASGTERS